MLENQKKIKYTKNNLINASDSSNLEWFNRDSMAGGNREMGLNELDYRKCISECSVIKKSA